ncbi:MAG: hypothetical protein AABZ08_00840 [Planctomycetota bacterium]
MKHDTKKLKVFFLTGLVLAMVVWVNAGNLTPPAGPVTGTMKDLATVEPRTPITSLPFTISSPGSYYVAKDLTGTSGQHGIAIASSDVSLDLSGFTLRGIPGSLNGIHVSGSRAKIRISNGIVCNWGGGGINTQSGDKVTIMYAVARDNGDYGVCTNGDTTVLYMNSNNNQNKGLVIGDRCICKDAECCNNGSDGIMTGSGCKIEDCVTSSNGGNGLAAGIGSMVTICVAQSNTLDGIQAADGCSVIQCTVRANINDGIEVNAQCLVLNNNSSNNGAGIGDGAGIHVVGSPGGGTRVDTNNCTGNDRNFDVDSTGNIITRNSSFGGTVPFDIAVGNSVGAVINVAGNGAFAVANAWSNFVY